MQAHDVYSRAFEAGAPEAIAALDETPYWSAPFGFRLLEKVKLLPGMRVLDIGCGAGFPLLELASRLHGKGQVTGLDPWQAGLNRIAEKARIRGMQPVELTKGVAERMPFEAAHFDAIVSNNGLNNVADVVQSLRECARVAKPRAQFVMTANLPGTFGLFYELFEALLDECGMQDVIQPLQTHIREKRKTLEIWIGLIEAAGFRLRSSSEDSFTWSFLDGSAFLNHWAIRVGFYSAWTELLPGDRAETFMAFLEGRLNRLALERGGLHLEVPFFCLDALRD